jgi:four helix bundle protein
MRNFRTLKIWNKGIDLVSKVYKIATMLPKEEMYGLKSQISRASVSIPSNIAEGCSRSSDLEYKRFLEMSLGSSFELETQLIIIEKLGLAEKSQTTNLLNDLCEEQKMINSLITKIKTDL